MKVNSLTHMVVVVDENSGESATAALEEQLQVSCQPDSICGFELGKKELEAGSCF